MLVYDISVTGNDATSVTFTVDADAPYILATNPSENVAATTTLDQITIVFNEAVRYTGGKMIKNMSGSELYALVGIDELNNADDTMEALSNTELRITLT